MPGVVLGSSQGRIKQDKSLTSSVIDSFTQMFGSLQDGNLNLNTWVGFGV